MHIKEKNILFICPKFHNYEDMIKDQLMEFGAAVDFYAERSYGIDFNIINNFFKGYLMSYQKKHYEHILKKIQYKHYDYLFVIRGFMLPESFLHEFKRLNPDSKTIMYQWDSQRTNSFCHLNKLFDIVKTFDFKDSEDLNIPYLPLFYTKDVQAYQSLDKVYDYDFFFMGFFFKERYEAILRFKDYCNANGYKLMPFLYMPISTRLKYFLKGKRLDRSIVSFKHMNRIDYLNILSKSRVMVDVSNSRQTGLAMRVIESLACNTKIATNNTFFERDENIKQSGMVFLFNLQNITIDRKFLNKGFESSNKLVLSLEEWTKKLFSV